MPTELMQTSEVMMTAVKDDALEVAVILHWIKRAFVTFFKVQDNERVKNLILTLGLSMENTVFNMSKRL
jgi:hypothetical protein